MATNKNFIVKNGLDVSGTANLSTLNLTGSLTGPATFTIDPAAIGDNTGTVVIAGNLQVDGTQTTINSTTMTVDDLNLTLASGAANAAAANGAGLTVDGASATLTYASSDDSWAVNKRFKAQSDIRLGSDGVRLSTDGNGEFGVGYGQTATNNRFTVYNNTTVAFRILPDGNVGIAKTTPTAWGSSYKSLQVGGRGYIGAHSGSDLYVGQNAYHNSGWKYEASVAASLTQHSGGKITQYVAPAGTAGNAISWNRAIDINPTGEVGVGLTPSNGIALKIGNSANNSAITRITNGTTSVDLTASSSGKAFLEVGTNHPLVLATNATERMRIDSSGRVSFGPDASDILIDPASTNSNNNLIYMRGNALSDKSSIQMNHYGFADYHIGVGHVGAGKFNIANETTGNDFVIDTAGNIGIGETSPDAKLDIRSSGTSTYPLLIKSSDDQQLFRFKEESDSRGTFYINDASESTKVTLASDGQSSFMGGNVGIGTNNPNSKLSIVGGATSPGLSINSGGNSGVDPFRVTWTNGTEGSMFIVDDNGNVGIGESGPQYRLQVDGTNVLSGGGLANLCLVDRTAYNGTLPGAGITFRGEYTSGGNTTNFATIQGIKENTSSGNYATALRFTTRFNGGNLTEKMRIDSSGNVGIGATSANSSRLRLDNGGTSGAPQLMLTATGASTQTEIRHDTSNNLIFENWNSGRTERMRITDHGDISIGGDHGSFGGWRVMNLRGRSTGALYNFEASDGTRRAAIANSGTDLRLQTFTGGAITFEPGTGSAAVLTLFSNVVASEVDISIKNGKNLELQTTSGVARGYISAQETNTGGTHPAGLVIATSGGETITFKESGIGGNTILTVKSGELLVPSTTTHQSVTPHSYIYGGNTGTYNKTVTYLHQNNTSGNAINGMFIELGRLSDSSTAEIRHFVVGARGGQHLLKVDGLGNLKTTGKVEVGTFPQSQNNSGEAWIGRAADRQDGTLTVQLGGDSASDTKFEIVDRAWTKVMYSFSGEAPESTLWAGSNGNTQCGPHGYNTSSGISLIGPTGRTFWDMNYNSYGAEILLVNNRTANGACSLLQYRTNSVVEGSIQANSTGLAISNVSDYRKKENIRDLTGSLSVIKSLQPRVYEYKEGFGTAGDHIGFIAHEIQEHIPKAVTGNKDDVYSQADIDEGSSEVVIGEPKYQAVSYTHNEIITRLVQSIQEQQTIIDDLKTRIEVLEG